MIRIVRTSLSPVCVMKCALRLLVVFFLLSFILVPAWANDDTFFDMIASNDIDGVKAAIAAGQDVNVRDREGSTPLHHALESQLKYVHRSKFYKDIVLDEEGGYKSGTPDAPIADCTILSLLIDAGADVNAVGTRLSERPLHLAARLSPKAITILLNASADVNADQANRFYNETPLFRAVLLNRDIDPASNVANVELLLQAGANVNARVGSRRGRTPLIYCGMSGLVSGRSFPLALTKIAQLLVEAGADVNVRDDDGITPLDDARTAGNNELEQYLKSVGAKSGKKWYWPF